MSATADKAATSDKKRKSHPSSDQNDEFLHCVRCHQWFQEYDNDNKSCKIEHDFDSFEGSRGHNGFYTGTLQCCGAYQRFHRHHDEETVDPPFCFQGSHTTEPAEVDYGLKQIQPCGQNCKCSDDVMAASQQEAEKQRASKKKQQQETKEAQQNSHQATKARIQQLQAQGKRREARQLRAEMIGYQCEDDDELNSDVDPDGCAEFDYASDSSLVPPWSSMNNGGDGGDYDY